MSSNWTGWAEFASASPRLAADVRALLEQYGQGFGYLATIRADGGPRVHPVAPVIADGGLFCFVLPSPKRRDLERDGRYALHSYPAESSESEAYLTGRARPATARQRELVAAAHRAAEGIDWHLYELGVEIAMVTHREPPRSTPDHRIWRAPRTESGPSRTEGAAMIDTG